MKHDIKNMFIVGAAVLAMSAGTIALPSIASAHGGGGGGAGGHGGGHMGGGHGGHFAGGHHGGRYASGGGYRRGYGGYGGTCGPIQIAAGLCGY